MALAKQLAELKFFNAGLDTRSQAKMVLPTKWSQLTNLTITADGTPRRRDAWQQLCSQSAANGLALFGNEALVVNGSALSSVNIQGAAAQAKTGQLGNVYVGKTEIYRTNGIQDSMDCATGGGYTVYAWVDYNLNLSTNGIKYTIVDEVTGNQLVSGGTVSASGGGPICPRVVFVAGTFYIVYPAPDNKLRARVISTSTPTTLGAETVLLGSAVASQNIDICEFNGFPCVVYGDTSNNVNAIQLDSVPAVINGPVTVFSFVADSIGAVACAKFNNTDVAIFALDRTTGTVVGILLRNDFATLDSAEISLFTIGAGSSAAHLCACLDASGNMRVYSDRQDAWNTDALNPIKSKTLNSSLGTVTATFTLVNSATFSGALGVCAGPQGPFIYGKPFLSGTTVYLPVCIMEDWTSATVITDATHAAATPLNQQNSFFLLDGSTGVVAAHALYGAFGIVWSGAPTVSTPTSVFSPSSGVFAMAVGERGLLQFAQGQNRSGTGICRLQFTPNTSVPPIRSQLSGTTLFPGGVLSDYDGAAVTEHGFFTFPEGVRVLLTNGAVLTSSSTYQLVAVYEWTDNSGQRHQSAPSPAVSFTTGASPTSCTATVSVPCLMLTQKTLKSLSGQVQIVIYMTAANGNTFYRNGSLTVFWISNNSNAFTGSINTTETSLSNEVLYSQPNIPSSGSLPNNSPPPCAASMVHQNRLWTDVADDPFAFRYSQQQIQAPGSPPTVGLQFNETLGGRVPQDGGNIVGLASLDDMAIIFCARKIYRVLGAGPGTNGLGGTYTDPIEIPSDVGCAEPRSILKMEDGLIFYANKGWHLLGRDLVVRYIGEGVESFNGRGTSGAVLLDDRKECRFSSSSGTTLVYSYLYRDREGIGQWSTFSNYAATDSIWWPSQSLYLHCTAAGAINEDTSTLLLKKDGGTSEIVTTARTAWIRLDKLNGFQRVWRMFLTGIFENTISPGVSNLTVAVDFDHVYGGLAAGAYSQVISTGSAPGGIGGLIEFRLKMQQQKCEAIAFTLTDTPTGNHGGANWHGMSLELGMKRGVNKLPAGQSF